jgi:hypothetical protein
VADQPKIRFVDQIPNRLAKLLVGFCVAVFLLGILVLIICSIVGLTTGYLFFPGRGQPLEFYGAWARVISVIILLFITGLVGVAFRSRKKKRRPKILGDRDHQ